jgi:transposase
LASVGTYLALTTANRVVAPCSKQAFADWWQTTAGGRLLRLPKGALDHRRFWDAMGALGEEELRRIERTVIARMIAEFGVDLSGLVLDMTNFATYIDSANPKAPIAQRGHAKQKRTDLRLVGLGLVVATDGGIPVCSWAYPGDRPDVTQLAAIVGELVARWNALGAEQDQLTLVFDAGQDSAANQATVGDSPLHFVGSLPPSDHPELLAVPRRRYRAVDQAAFPGLTAFQARAEALGGTRRVVVCHSPTLHAKQVRGFEQTLAGVARRLGGLAERLARGRTRRGRQAVAAEVAQILKPRWVSRVVTWSLTGERPADLRLAWAVDEPARRALEEEIFGKRVLFTDREDWPVAQVVAAYRSQAEVEADFRQMKDPKVVSFSPLWHWTDQKTRVHVFCCVLALAVARLLRREAARAGLALSVRELLGHLAGVQETVLLYQGERGRPRARHLLTDMDATQQRLYDLFGLDAYAPGPLKVR